MANDNIQHGIDDNPTGDAEKGAALGGLGGAAVGAAAGSLAGPVGTVVGAVVGGLTGAGASGVAVAAVDQVDNDNTVSGVGHGATPAIGSNVGTHTHTDGTVHADGTPHIGGTSGTHTHPDGTVHAGAVHHTGEDVVGGHNIVTGDQADTDAGKAGLAGGALVGGTIGAALGGPVGAVVGGALGSLTGGAAGDAAEADAEGDARLRNSDGTSRIV